MNMIKGYKAFKKGLINRYGEKLELNKKYVCDGDLSFGKNGYHFCKNIEDTLRYVDGFNDDIVICEVTGFNDFITYEDEYNGYYNLYCTREIVINKILTYEEIIDIIDELDITRLKRFIQGYKLQEAEKEKYKNKYLKVLCKDIEYYQEGNKDAFNV